MSSGVTARVSLLVLLLELLGGPADSSSAPARPAGQHAGSAAPPGGESRLYASFREFVLKYKKPYLNDSRVLGERFLIFKENVAAHRFLNAFRNSESSAVYGITKFSDLSPDEFKAKYLSGFRPVLHPDPYLNPITDSRKWKNLRIPLKLDWRTKNVITSVNNQGTCGACWAFSVVETIESMFAIQTGKKVYSLSTQQLIDCAGDNTGCKGGDTCRALRWLMQNKTAIVGAEQYPFVGHTQSCKLVSSTRCVRVSNYSCDSYIGSENEMLYLLATVGPLSIGVDASTWNNYQGGVIQFHCSATSNHAVQIVGYDLTGDIPCYIVRNSWGTDFGINGYLKIKIGSNLCGVANEVSAISVM